MKAAAVLQSLDNKGPTDGACNSLAVAFRFCRRARGAVPALAMKTVGGGILLARTRVAVAKGGLGLRRDVDPFRRHHA